MIPVIAMTIVWIGVGLMGLLLIVTALYGFVSISRVYEFISKAIDEAEQDEPHSDQPRDYGYSRE